MLGGWWLTSQKHNENIYGCFFWAKCPSQRFFQVEKQLTVSQFIKFKAVYSARYEPSPVDC